MGASMGEIRVESHAFHISRCSERIRHLRLDISVLGCLVYTKIRFCHVTLKVYVDFVTQAFQKQDLAM